MGDLFWIIILIAAILLEAVSYALVSMWFGVGAIAALITSMLTGNAFIQWSVFVVVTAICLIFTRPFLKKIMPERRTPTNAELNLGRSAVVIEDIDNAKGTGRAKLDGVDWRAVTPNGERIAKDTTVTVIAVQSAKIVVQLPEVL